MLLFERLHCYNLLSHENHVTLQILTSVLTILTTVTDVLIVLIRRVVLSVTAVLDYKEMGELVQVHIINLLKFFINVCIHVFCILCPTTAKHDCT